MSGIAGYLGAQQELTVLQSMVRKLTHRGPDAEGFHIEPPVFMGVRRLATIDPGENWLPLYSEDRKIAIVFAGELFNLGELRPKLQERGVSCRTRTDAEAALRLYQAYGANCVTHMRGHFAFAIHDAQKNLVFIARDRLGVQPLYYTTTQSGSFIFASEVKALLEHPSVKVIPDLMTIDAFLSLGYAPGTGTMFKGIHALPPGHRLIWNPGLHVMIEPYWQWESYAKPDPALKTDDDFQERFDALLEESVALRQAEDVPVGAFATGSLESAAILSIMAKNSSRPLSVFTAAFGAERDGVPPAAELVGRLGGMHGQVEFEPEYMDRLPELVWALDAPVADPNVVMLHLLARLASRKVKVAVSGAGANNIFVNYPQHDTLLAAHKLPRTFWPVIKEMKAVMPLGLMARKLQLHGKFGPAMRQRLLDFAEMMRAGSLQQQYLCLSYLFDSRARQKLYLAPLSQVMGTITDQHRERAEWPSLMAALLAMQHDHLLCDGVLMPVDKITMFNSLGTRFPLLDHKLFEFMLGVPDHLRRAGERRKVLLRNYVDKAMPGIANNPPRPEQAVVGQKTLLETCFASGPLREMMDACLSDSALKRRDLFDVEAARQVVAQAKAGEAAQQRQAFALLVLELWFRIFIDHEKGWLSS